MLRYPRIFLGIAAALLYFPSLFGDFVYDDKALTVEQNPALHGEASLPEILSWDRPLREFTYLFDHALWGFRPFGYHLQNIFWHTANTLLVYAFLQLLAVESRLAFCSALLFAIHPVDTESVAWISGRKELLCLFFELAACFFFIKTIIPSSKSPWTSYIACFSCCLLALLSKQVAVVLPFLLALSGWFYQQQTGAKIPFKQFVRLLLFPSIIVTAFVLFKYSIPQHLLFVQESGAFYDPAARDVPFTPLSAILSPCATFLQSLWLFFWPMDLTVERAFPPVQSLADPRWYLGALLGVLACFIAWKQRISHPGFSFGFAWLLCAWLPVCGGAPVAYLLADRYLYIPYAGLSFAALSALFSLRSNQETRTFSKPVYFLIPIFLFFSVRTLVRIADWRNEITLWQSVLWSRPDNAKAWSGLGMAYADNARYEEAFQAWDQSLALDSDQPRVWVNMGNTEKQRGNLEASEQCYRKALELFPDYGAAHFNLALLLEQQNKTDAALQEYQAASETLYHRLNTDYRKGLAHYHIARILYQKGEIQAARYHLQHALLSASTYPPIYLLQGILDRSDPDSAKNSFAKAIQLDPQYAEAYFNLGLLEWQTGDHEKAEEHWQKALHFNPALSPQIDSVRKNLPPNP